MSPDEMISEAYLPFHARVSNLREELKQEIKLKLNRPKVVDVSHQGTLVWRTAERIRTINIFDPRGKYIGGQKYFVTKSHTYRITTPKVNENEIDQLSNQLEKTIKTKLVDEASEQDPERPMRLSVDVSRHEIPADSKKNIAWLVTINELIHPDDIPDST